MPNTLAHIGINGILTKSIIKRSDLLWIYLGCVIPDFPWIVRKIVAFFLPSINGYDLQAYVIVEASLIFCIVLSASLASLSKNFWKTFLILSLGSLFHLSLDSLQIKWANGVHLLAPFNWNLINFGFFWPESFPTYFLTVSGLLFFLINWKNIRNTIPQLSYSKKNTIISSLFILIYFLAPLHYMKDVEKADNHFISTLKDVNNRVNKYVEADRKKIVFNEKTNSYWIESFNKDYIELSGVENIESSRLSIKGIFVSNNLIEVKNYKENWVAFRDGASYLGLLLIILVWMMSIGSKFTQKITL